MANLAWTTGLRAASVAIKMDRIMTMVKVDVVNIVKEYITEEIRKYKTEV